MLSDSTPPSSASATAVRRIRSRLRGNRGGALVLVSIFVAIHDSLSDLGK
jgi:hypothetical protein